MKLENVPLEGMDEVANQLIQFAGNSRVILLNGDLGAGKTTLVTRFCAALGVDDIAQSPTFALVNEYQVPGDEKIYHLDLYRLNSLEEALDIGVEEYLDSGHWCLIEWPDKIEPLLPEDVIKVYLESNLETRTISFQN